MRLRALVVVGVASALLAGCSAKAEDGADAGSSSAAKTSSQSSPSPTTPVDTEQNGAAQAGVDPRSVAKPIASVTATTGMEDDPKGTIKVDVLGLQRKDKLLVMTAAVTPTNSLAEPKSLFRLLDNHSWRPRLIDSVNLKEYSPVSGSRALMSQDVDVEAVSGQPLFVYAAFAAPPAGVTTINILFADSVPTLSDVPIS